jgi:hypothetical protein
MEREGTGWLIESSMDGDGSIHVKTVKKWIKTGKIIWEKQGYRGDGSRFGWKLFDNGSHNPLYKEKMNRFKRHESHFAVSPNYEVVANVFRNVLMKYDIKLPGSHERILEDMKYTLSTEESDLLNALLVSFSDFHVDRKRDINTNTIIEPLETSDTRSLEEKFPNENQWWDRMDRQRVSLPNWARVRSIERPVAKLDPKFTTYIPE